MKECPVCGYDETQKVDLRDGSRSLLLIMTDDLAAAATRVRMAAERYEGCPSDEEHAMLQAFARDAERTAQILAGFTWKQRQPARPLVSGVDEPA